MHELAIAEALIDLVRRRRPANRPSAGTVEIEVGALTGLVPECLAFYWDGLTRGTELEGFELACRAVPARVRCRGCGGTYEPAGFAPVCAACGALGGEVLSGEELNLLRIEELANV